MQNFEVYFYKKADDTEPAKDFLNSLDIKMQAKMIRTIEIERAKQYRTDYLERGDKYE